MLLGYNLELVLPLIHYPTSAYNNNKGVIDNFLEIFKKRNSIPENISKETLRSILGSLSIQDRIITSEDQQYIIFTPTDKNSDIVVKLLPLDKNNLVSTLSYYGLYWRRPNRNYGSTAYSENDWRTIFDYYRSQNETYNDSNLRSLFGDRNLTAIRKFIEANPPLDPANNLRPVIYQDGVYLFNTQNPRESYRISPQSGRLLAKVFSARDAAVITGQPAPAATRRGRQPGAAAAATPPAAAGQVNDAV